MEYETIQFEAKVRLIIDAKFRLQIPLYYSPFTY